MTKSKNLVPGTATSVPAFSPIIEPEYGYLSDLPQPITIGPGVKLIEQGQRPKFVGLLRSGIVRLTYMSDEGDEATLGLRSEGWWLNANLALLNVSSLCGVVTLTDCSISRLGLTEFSDRLNQNREELYNFLLAQCRELLMLQQHSIMRGSSATERLSYLLGESSQSIWKTVDPTPLMRQSDIADLLSITPEHLSRLRHKTKERQANSRTD